VLTILACGTPIPVVTTAWCGHDSGQVVGRFVIVTVYTFRVFDIAFGHLFIEQINAILKRPHHNKVQHKKYHRYSVPSLTKNVVSGEEGDVDGSNKKTDRGQHDVDPNVPFLALQNTFSTKRREWS
jgi:hypothetical protein